MVETLGLNYLLVVLFLLVTVRPPSCAPRRLSLAGGVWLKTGQEERMKRLLTIGAAVVLGIVLFAIYAIKEVPKE